MLQGTIAHRVPLRLRCSLAAASSGRGPVGRIALRVTLRIMVIAVALATASAASAGTHTVAECFEGSDFIRNAARARDNGMTRGAFLERLQGDFALIRAYPPELRWFAKDADDERLLFDAAAEVFDAPRSPDVHRAHFLALCFERTSV
jgi:hypothetical protein